MSFKRWIQTILQKLNVIQLLWPSTPVAQNYRATSVILFRKLSPIEVSIKPFWVHSPCGRFEFPAFSYGFASSTFPTQCAPSSSNTPPERGEKKNFSHTHPFHSWAARINGIVHLHSSQVVITILSAAETFSLIQQSGDDDDQGTSPRWKFYLKNFSQKEPERTTIAAWTHPTRKFVTFLKYWSSGCQTVLGGTLVSGNDDYNQNLKEFMQYNLVWKLN